MKYRLFSLAAALFLIAVLACPMWAEPLNPTIQLTVKQPVELPGHVLAPGHYTITQLDSGNAVLVRSADGSRGFFEVAGRASRMKPADGTLVDVDREMGSVPRIMDYYFPGASNGTAFYYPASVHTKMAKKAAHKAKLKG